MQPNKKNVIIIILLIFLIIAIGYIVLNKYQEKQKQKQLDIFQNGIQFGYEQAIIQLVQQALTCKQVPITTQIISGNETTTRTINVISVECLQQTNK